jgi:hypothetical protein
LGRGGPGSYPFRDGRALHDYAPRNRALTAVRRMPERQTIRLAGSS